MGIMSLSVSIEYKDSARSPFTYPFCPQSVLTRHWWRFARQYNLDVLGRLEDLFIVDGAEAEQLIRELRFVESLLREPGQIEVPEIEPEGILGRLAVILPALDGAIAEWENVRQISI
jgi:hypothetical protein